MTFPSLALKKLAAIRASNVDKHTTEGEQVIQLCNYTDVYNNESITADMEFMTATATLDQVQQFSLRAGDSLITKDSESPTDIGVSAFVPADLPSVLCGYHLSVIRPDQKHVDPKFLYWSLKSAQVRGHFTMSANGVTRFALGYGEIGSTQMPLPPLPVQIAAARFLDHTAAQIDELLDQKMTLRERLLEERRSLIDSLLAPFTKDGGTRAKVLMSEVKDRPIGKPELLSVSHLTGVSRRGDKTVSMFLAESFDDYKVCKEGDLVINTMWAWMGAAGVAPLDGIVSPAYAVYRIRPDAPIDRRFLDYLIRSPYWVSKMAAYSEGVWRSRLRLYPDVFLSMHLPLPTFEQQAHIVRTMEERLVSQP